MINGGRRLQGTCHNYISLIPTKVAMDVACVIVTPNHSQRTDRNLQQLEMNQGFDVFAIIAVHTLPAGDVAKHDSLCCRLETL